MIRATTPTHKFTLPDSHAFILENLKTLLVTYSQCGKIVLEKTEANAKIEGNTISFRLTQEETKLFSAKPCISVQIRFLLTSGDCISTRIHHLSCEDVLNDEVLK